jgi:hypothetical protein
MYTLSTILHTHEKTHRGQTQKLKIWKAFLTSSTLHAPEIPPDVKTLRYGKCVKAFIYPNLLERYE